MAEERRLVTILFADVVDSTAMGESMDPEDVRALLGRLFEIAREAIEEHGGRVEKFIGDAIMAVFGLPTAHEDDAARALSAALDLRDRVRADPALGDRLPIRLGVNGGEVIATRDADAQQFLVTGDAVNTAARLQQGGEAWTILVGDRTVRAAGERFSFGPPLAIQAKGKGAPIAARSLEGRVEGPAKRRDGRLVGREADLAQLELVAQRSFDERRPYLVSIVAPAGVGKSRLLEEFLGRLDRETQVALAQCLPYGQRLTYWPMRSILLSIVGSADDISADELRNALLRWFQDAAEPDAERSADLLVATVGGPEVEGGDRLSLFAAWRRFIELAAERSPIVLVIEDLHWSSDSLLDLVEAILQPRVDVPLLMIALARPELLDRRPSWGGGRRNAVSIALQPLPSKAVAELVADLLGADDPQIIDAVVRRADGNPFYAGEIVRSLVDRVGLDGSPEAVAEAIASLPDTVHATVLARLDALEPPNRRAVQLGAVLGRTFEPAALCALDSSLSPVDAEAAIASLIDHDLLRPGSGSRVTFRHILIREVAYGTLPRAERARLHAAAGTWLETAAVAGHREEELAELVAFHLREATLLGSLLGDGASPEIGARAVSWLRRAAEAAAAGAAGVEAARHLNAALELAPREAQVELYERLGQVWVGGDQALEAFDRAYELTRELRMGPDHELRTLAQWLIVHTRWTGSVSAPADPDERERRYRELERIVSEAGNAISERSHLLAELALGFRTMPIDRPDPEASAMAAVHAEHALAKAEEVGDADLLSAALDAVVTAAISDDRPRAVMRLVERRFALADRVSTAERADALIVASWMHALLGELEAAERAADRAREGLVSGQASNWVLGATAWRILALHALGRWDEALVDATRAERSWLESELQAPWYALNGFMAAYAVAHARGDVVAADHWRELTDRIYERSDRSIRTTRLHGFVHGQAAPLVDQVVVAFRDFTGRLDYVHLVLGLLADQRHPVPTPALDAIVEYCEPRDQRLVTAQALRLRGIVGGSRADLEVALGTFEAMGARPYSARTRTELGLLTGDRDLVGRGLDALEALGDVVQAARVAQQLREGGSTVVRAGGVAEDPAVS
jgi:predicted ATPase/class 3 adenylate cyclase